MTRQGALLDGGIGPDEGRLHAQYGGAGISNLSSV
jgi:hypothetical protein